MTNFSDLSKQSLLKISEYLNAAFKEEGVTETNPGQWISFETETLMLDLNDGMLLPALLLDKVDILQTLNVDPSLFFSDPMFFVYVCEVVGGEVADFSTFILPTSLEMVGGIYEVQELLFNWKFPAYEFTEGMKSAIGYILRQEGYSTPVEPFGFVPSEMLATGQSEEDTQNKIKAIKAYTNYLRTR